MKLSPVRFFPTSLPPSTENLFGTYYEKGDLIAKKDMYSAEEQDDPLTNSNRYVLADITSFFTLLVGIYFPSVTGENSYFFADFLTSDFYVVGVRFFSLRR